jgi:drug/metabolite transporter (DMT)-like permease
LSVSSHAAAGTERPNTARTAALASLAMVAFAGNSLLCRAALGLRSIDAASFTTLRLLSGAIVLLLLARALPASRAGAGPGAGGAPAPRDWVAALVLFGYAIAFSFAYTLLTAGIGALILFGTVQATMFVAGLSAGERFGPVAWCGVAVAVAGVAWLVAPGVSAPNPLGAALMAAAGIGWGVYSLRGRRLGDPVRMNADSFLRSLPLTIATSVVLVGIRHVTPEGAALAIASGAVTSGVGYIVWYAALQGLTATCAAVIQLSVPAIAAIGGVVFLLEPVSWRLVLSSIAILGGIAVTLTRRARSV